MECTVHELVSFTEFCKGNCKRLERADFVGTIVKAILRLPKRGNAQRHRPILHLFRRQLGRGVAEGT